jgi:hypothetical protein
MIYFPKKIKKLDIFHKQPFIIFEKKNFFNDIRYQELLENFPNKKYFLKKDKKGGKLSFSNKDETFFKFLGGNQIWSNFYNEINSSTFLQKFVELIKKDLKNVSQRKKLRKFVYIDNDKKKLLLSRIKKKIISKFSTPVRIGMQFSIIKSGNFIPPHCDTTNKLLSLMIYFPDKNKIFKQKETSLGTNFFKKKDGLKKIFFDGWNNTLLSKEDTKVFFKNYKLFYKSKFEKNKIIGFVKNDKSWHNVDKFNFSSSYLRKSVNINLYLD